VVDKINEITEGLNTQIPISDVDLLALSEVTEKINKKMKSEHIRIIRDGEYCDKYNIPVLEFAKKFKIIQLKPGTSKNLNKKIVEEIMEKANVEPDLGKKLRQVIEADDWWKNKQDKMDDKDDPINRYGRNYYCSYVMYRWMEECNENSQERYFYDEELLDIYNEFIDSIKSSRKEYETNDFKKDELFEQIIKKETSAENADMCLTEDERKSIIEYLNTKKLRGELLDRLVRYNNALLHNKGIKDCRSVVRVKGESDAYIVNSDFMLSSSSFLQFSDISEESFGEFTFSQSVLKKEIEKKYVVLVIDESNKEVQDVHLINLSFEDYEKDAEDVFIKTKKAFEAGDESLLPSFVDGDSFCVRPLYATPNDTFEFSNGKDIARRTFFVGKGVVGELIEKGLRDI